MEKSLWKVKYQDLRALATHHPFYNLFEEVRASSRIEAIEFVKDKWDCYGHYGNYKASKIKGS